MTKPVYLKQEQFRGAGGGGKDGGGGGRAPVEAPDTLLSIQYAKVLDLISEGEIGGLVDGLRSIYLNDTPIQNQDGTFNFTNVVMDSRVGTQAQAYMAGFNGAEAETTVGTEVTNATSVTRSISNVNDTALRITLGFPQMTSQDPSTGDLNGTSVVVNIEVQNNGGGFVGVPLRDTLRKDWLVLTVTGAETTVASTAFEIDVRWRGTSIDTQTAQAQLEYRVIGSGPWLVAAVYDFYGKGGKATVNTPQAFDFLGNPVSSETFLGGGKIVVTTSAGGKKTFNLTLASALYEFRVVKNSGMGTFKITGGTVLEHLSQDTITGKNTSRYQRAYRVELPAPGPWDIRVSRITADNGSATLQNKTYWDSYTEIVDAKLSYPNSAYIGLKIDSKQFNSIPTRGFDCYLLLVQVPTNYNPLSREYSGAWSGSFKVAWTDNPAWVFYDMVVNDRYGLGEFIDASQVDKWALYSIAQYCDEMVDDGFGGTEPRFTCNLYLQTREQAFNVIANLASVFRGMAWWSAGAMTVSQDAPATVSQLFTAANVVGGEFNYSGSSGRVRHNVCLVGWNDPQDAYRQKIEYVEDTAGIARYGVIQSEIVATGCTSRGQAHRVGRWLIYSEQNETETITFRAGLDAVFCGPGDIIQTSDPIRGGTRFGGRLLSGGISQVQLDAPFTIEPTISYTLSCVLPDGSVETRDVTTAAATTDVIDVATPFSIAPQIMSIWVLASTSLVPQSWRIVSMAEVNKTQLDITALAYRAEKYAVVEQNLVLEPLPISLIEASQPDLPAALIFTEVLYLSGLAVIGVKGTISWQTVPNAIGYVLVYQRAEQNPVTISGILNNSIDIQPMQEGEYSISVFSVNELGRRSQANTINIIVYGKTLPPLDVTSFSVTKSSGVAVVAWALHPDLDVQVGGNIVVRHSPLTTGAVWENGIILDAFSGNATSGLLPLITGTYMAKALDSSGNWSETMVGFVATEGLVTGFTTVGTLTEDPTFSGTKTNTVVASSALKLNGTLTGSYDFSSVLDLTTVATRRYEADIAALSFDLGQNIDDRLDAIDSWGLIDGTAVDDCDATLYVATTDDNPAGSPTWSPWIPFFVSDFTCRATKYKLDLLSGNANHNISVSTLRVHAKIPT
jgi:predicted phage tail protein